MLDHLIAIAARLRRELQDRRELRELLEKDPRILSDIGLTRADIQASLDKPLIVAARSEAYRLSRLSLELDRVR